MSLAADVMDLIWAKLAVAYGHRFLSLWEGLPQEIVKADWAERLDGVALARIEWALQNLPAGRPPDAMEFRAICYRMPDRTQRPLALTNEAPTHCPDGIKELAKRLTSQPRPSEPFSLRWARAYIAQFGGAGLKLRHSQRKNLEDARRILARHEADTTLEDRKRETQDRVDAAMLDGIGEPDQPLGGD